MNIINKTEVIIILISWVLGIVFIVILEKYKSSTYKVIDINYKDSLYIEINSILWDGSIRGIRVNDSLCLGQCYNLFDKSNPQDGIIFVYEKFRILTKKSNNDTLITIDKNGQMRYYNVRTCDDE